MLSKQLERVKDDLLKIEEPLVQTQRDSLIEEIDSAESYDVNQLVDLIERSRRPIVEVLVGAHSNPALITELGKTGEISWELAHGLDIPMEQATAIAKQLFASSHSKSGDKIVVHVSPEAKLIVEKVVRICEDNGVDFNFDFTENFRSAIFAKHLSDDKVTPEDKSPLDIYAQTRLALYENINQLIRVTAEADPRVSAIKDKFKSNLLSGKLSQIDGRRRDGSLQYILTILPTFETAKLDNIPFEEYVQLFLESCDQPWDEIKKGNEVLVNRFDRAQKVKIQNDDGTDLSLDITGQTFVNSVVLKNLPGSEVFSSPLKFGVDGRIVSKGRFQYDTSGVIEDITLDFDKGRIVNFSARVGNDDLSNIIHRDDNKGEGTRYLGEIGFGTNPHLRHHLINSLLVEKICGSFHVAIGSCYRYEVYDGKPVKLKNGNRSASEVHFDLTTLLRGKNGLIELTYEDGNTEAIQKDGDWIVPGCEILNKGWGVMPEEVQPGWWKKRYARGYRN